LLVPFGDTLLGSESVGSLIVLIFCEVWNMVESVSAWSEQVERFLEAYEGATVARYAASLRSFEEWYRQSYAEAPDAKLLTDVEVRDYRAYLMTVKGYKAATVNSRLAPIRALVREHGRTLRVKGVKQVIAPKDILDARDLGRLLSALDGPSWRDKRNVALVNVLARAGLRISEALALKVDDLELGARSGSVIVRMGKGLRERRVPLPVEARAVLTAYLKVRPEDSDVLFLTRTHAPLLARDAFDVTREGARRAGLSCDVTPHTLRHYFATRFLEKNQGDIATLAQVLCHANIATTARYLHPPLQRLQSMVERVD
jgi:integrase/recombinase XerC